MNIVINKKLALEELGDFPHYIMHRVDFHHSTLPAFRNVSKPRTRCQISTCTEWSLS